MTISLDRWIASWQQIGAPPSRKLFAALTARYSEPHRKYHTLTHLEECFAALAPAAHLAERLGEVEVALWFHDAVYDPHRKDNEDESACWAAEAILSSGADRPTATRIHALILATRHADVPADADARLTADVDLAILAAPPHRFAEYERQIREEYAWVPEAEFRAGRSRILNSFLACPTIYTTPFFTGRFEAPARENLTRSVQNFDVQP